MNLQENLQEQIKSGNVNISSADFKKSGEGTEENKKINNPSLENSIEDATEEVEREPVLKSTSKKNNVEKIQGLFSSIIDTENIEITTEDKNNFIDAVVKCECFRSSVSILKDRFNIKLKSRLQTETEAIFKYIGSELEIGGFNNTASYLTFLKGALCLVHVEEVNGVRMQGLKEPLFKHLDENNELRDPAWVKDVSWWLEKSEIWFDLIFREVFLFEAKYLKMLREAKNPNF